jgi:hypothetical protein
MTGGQRAIRADFRDLIGTAHKPTNLAYMEAKSISGLSVSFCCTLPTFQIKSVSLIIDKDRFTANIISQKTLIIISYLTLLESLHGDKLKRHKRTKETLEKTSYMTPLTIKKSLMTYSNQENISSHL